MSEPDDREPAATAATPARARRAPWWRRRPVLIAAAAVAVIGGAATAVRSIGGGPDDLPSPRVAAHDPVPMGPVFRTVPKNCGVTGKTREKLVPDARIGMDGSELACEWAPGASTGGGLSVTAGLAAGPHTWVSSDGRRPVSWKGTAPSTIGTAIGAFDYLLRNVRPGRLALLRGLGDEAVLIGDGTGGGTTRTGRVVFRAGNAIMDVRYRPVPGTTAKPGASRAGALRAATDVARSLGVPAAPAPAPAPRAGTPPASHASLCAAVPKDLRGRLVPPGSDDAGVVTPAEEDADPLGADVDLTRANARSCAWSGRSRVLVVSVTSVTSVPADAGREVRDVARRYLLLYYGDRDERPLTARDHRYFHALAGAGDEGFCSYLEESRGSGGVGKSPAHCVIRRGPVLVTVTYGTGIGPPDEDPPLTAREAVNGAYAAALPVLRSVTH